jgi:hypothetical protein
MKRNIEDIEKLRQFLWDNYNVSMSNYGVHQLDRYISMFVEWKVKKVFD